MFFIKNKFSFKVEFRKLKNVEFKKIQKVKLNSINSDLNSVLIQFFFSINSVPTFL